ncbi:hypothetical protein P167DRAFT_601826 [Morchella conica CCBAS932]|uniref:Uncharacterized protein n=1 Tax=Morchella conica CCBAS932 TaxID=1392247 RepID=A0A3N4L372_9PEZI|nr:hypothetical protein P167DRAFT_601826 [Morchella conica CCBAS932]
MAAAYRAVERIHAPLTHPLVDMNPAIAHKKLYWSSSFQKMQEDMVANTNRDYSDIKTHYPRRRDVDDLIVLNVYTTNSPTPAWGLGPSPLSPLYLHYPAPHPADHTLPKLPMPKVSALQSISTNHAGSDKPAPDRPSMLQYFLDRKDFTTRQSTTTTCVRFLEEYAEWRLIFGPAENAGDSDAVPASEKTLRQKLGLKACATEVTRALGEDTIAARIYATPRVRAVSKARFSSTTPDGGDRSVVAPALYMAGQEISGEPGVILHYSKSADRRRKYWWVWEGSSWSCVYDPDGTTEWREGYRGSGESAARRRERELAEAEAVGCASAGVDDSKDSKRSSTASGVDELNCTVIKLYNSDYPEPVAAIELGAGQMWIQKTIVLETIDVAVAVIFAIVNMERAVRDERAARATNGRKGFIKRHFSL